MPEFRPQHAFLCMLLGAYLTILFGAAWIGPSRPIAQTAEQSHFATRAGASPNADSEGRLATYTLWLMVFTGVLAFSTIGLWGITWRSSIKQSRDMKDAIAASQEANKLNRENTIADRRAWLTIEDVQLIHPTEFREDGILLRVQFTVRNLGKTPAQDVLMEAAHRLIASKTDSPNASDNFVARIRNTVKIGLPGTVIFPNDTFVYSLMWSIQSEEAKLCIRDNAGSKFIDLMIFAGTAYKVTDDLSPHVTFIPFILLNAPVGSGPVQGLVKLQHASVIRSVVD